MSKPAHKCTNVFSEVELPGKREYAFVILIDITKLPSTSVVPQKCMRMHLSLQSCQEIPFLLSS